MSQPTPSRPLDYKTRAATRPPPAWLIRGMWYCGIVPAVVAIATVVGYAMTGSAFFLFFGFLWVLLGGIAVLAGLAMAFRQFSWPMPSGAPRLGRRGIIAVMILLLNFPIALGCAAWGTWLMSRVDVTIYNDGAVTIDQITIKHGTDSAVAYQIPPGGRRTIKLTINRGWDVTAAIRRNGIDESARVIGGGDEDDFHGPMDVHVDSAGVARLRLQ